MNEVYDGYYWVRRTLESYIGLPFMINQVPEWEIGRIEGNYVCTTGEFDSPKSIELFEIGDEITQNKHEYRSDTMSLRDLRFYLIRNADRKYLVRQGSEWNDCWGELSEALIYCQESKAKEMTTKISNIDTSRKIPKIIEIRPGDIAVISQASRVRSSKYYNKKRGETRED